MNQYFDHGFARQAIVLMAGRRWWLLPLVPLPWPILVRIVLAFNGEASGPDDARGLIGLPLAGLAIFLGIRVIAGEIDDGSLEVAYTVPGGVCKLWLIKLVASLAILISAELLLAITTLALFKPFPPGILYGALQAAAFYLVVATAFGALFRGEAASAMATGVILAFNGIISDMGANQIVISPFFNPYALAADPETILSSGEIFARTLQNRIGILLVMAGILSLAFMRANRRERMLE